MSTNLREDFNVHNLENYEEHETETHDVKLKCHLYDHQRKKYCPKCHGLLELDDVCECKWCNGWSKEVDIPATLALNEYNPIGQVKVWRWVRN
jgi:hypothetical protein